MSTKLTVSLANSRKICEQLVATEVSRGKIRRMNYLEKNIKNQCNQKMRQSMQACVDMSNKYVELTEFKKFSCINIDHAIPELKMTKEEEEDGPSDSKYEQLKINKRKRRRYKNSFLNANNLVQWSEAELNPERKNIYQGPTSLYFEQRERQHAQYALTTLIKTEHTTQ